MSKRILYLTFYFEPDLCAGSFRNSPLARELALKGKDMDVEVDVLTTLPNRYSSYSSEALEFETNGNLSIKRIIIPAHKSGIKDQIRSFKVFYNEVNKYIKGREYDLVFASSSRLFTAFLGYRIARRKKLPLYLDIRDIFVDTVKDVFSSAIVRNFLLPLLKRIERKTFGYATHINLISGGFNDYFLPYKKATITNFSNGIDPVFLEAKKLKNNNEGIKTIVYAGNIGEGQGLHKIVPAVAKQLEGKIMFKIIGDGGAKGKLILKLNEGHVKNVEILPPVGRAELIKAYNDADFLFIHLNDYDAFKKVLPSKVFELGLFPKPLIAGVSGYARHFIEENLPDSILFKPCNSAELVKKLTNYKEGEHNREEFTKNFQREAINKKMADSILTYL